MIEALVAILIWFAIIESIPFRNTFYRLNRLVKVAGFKCPLTGVTKEETFDYVLNIDVTGRTLEELLDLRASHWKGSESRNHWIRDA